MEKPKKKKRKIVLWIVLGVVAFLVIFAASYVMMGKGTIQNMTIGNVSVADVSDGIYTGAFDGYRWSNTLQVTVNGGQITDIEIIKDQSVAMPDVDKLFASIKEKQSLQVDAVSGATVTCKAYLKAIENAIGSAK